MNTAVEHDSSMENKTALDVLEQVMFASSTQPQTGRVNSQNLLGGISAIAKELKNKTSDVEKTEIKIMESASGRTFLLNQLSLLSLFALSCFSPDKNDVIPQLLGASSFFYLLCGGFIHVVAPENWSYSWIRKIVRRKKSLDMKQQNLEQYIQKVQAIINQKHFQHAYLAHLQLSIKNLEEELENLKQKNRIEDYNLIQKLASYLEYFKINQNNLINAWAEGKPVQGIVERILEVEKKLTEINQQILSGNSQKQQGFMAEHHEFLQKQGLIDLLGNAPLSEKLKTLL